MTIKLSDLWTPRGTVGNRAYAFWGVSLFALKYGIDRVVAHVFFGRPWWIWSYLTPGTTSLDEVRQSDRTFFITLLAIALPFIWTGTVLTLRRLRDAAMKPWLVIFFFIPIANLFLFVILSLVPSRPQPVKILSGKPGGKKLDRLIPQSVLGSAFAAVLVNVVSGLIFTRLSVHVLQQYGWGLFVGLPFCLGLTSTLIYTHHQRRSLAACISVALISLGFVFLGLLVFAFEGVVCLFMAAPFAGGIAIFGAYLGYIIRSTISDIDASDFYPAILLLIPAMMFSEKISSPPAGIFVVKTSVIINAPPEDVWTHVVSFSEIPEPTEWFFRAGIAYPIRATINGSGAGALRHCVFSTGEFTEPIVVWNEPRLLKFTVESNPPPMEEYTFYAHLRPAHLAHFLESKGGQFLLIPRKDNRTELEGTTWYQHHMWPEFYWRWWADYLIHKIHLRVLNHVKMETEFS